MEKVVRALKADSIIRSITYIQFENEKVSVEVLDRYEKEKGQTGLDITVTPSIKA